MIYTPKVYNQNLLETWKLFNSYRLPEGYRFRIFKNGKISLFLNNRTVAKMQLIDLDEPSVFITNFEVHPKLRNKGYGTIALNQVMLAMKEASKEAISLKCLLSNERAYRLYARNGFFIAYTDPFKEHYVLTKKL